MHEEKDKGNKPTLKFYTRKNEEVAIHPSSTLFGATDLPSEQEKWLTYHEKVKTSKVYIRDGTLISPYPLLLFGGTIDVRHEQRMVEVDKWLLFHANAKARLTPNDEDSTTNSIPQVGVLMKKLRRELDQLLLLKIEDPQTNISELGQNVIDTIVTLIATEGQQTETAITS